MAISPCVCFSCAPNWTQLPELQVTTNPAMTKVPKDVWLHEVFKRLDKAALLKAAQMCKHWRYAATLYYKLAENTLRGAGCFKPLLKDFEASRHVIFMDVSSSMNQDGSRENALEIFKEITGQIRSAIAVNGLYVCKFAEKPAVRHFEDAVKAEKFLHEQSKLPDGTQLSAAVDAVYDKILKRENKKETHFYILSDMQMQHDNALNAKVFNTEKLSVLNKKVTFHYYPTKTAENPVLNETGKQYELVKDNPVPGLEKKVSDCIEVKFYGYHTKKAIIAPEVIPLD
ncbi:MAG: hypothetical protein LLF94_09355 [Chlamydiales bacterium]|nr:hypothetical protein [Chlamydiales bacterium]